MALRNIILDSDPTLTKTSRVVTNFDKRLHILLDDMTATLREAQGAGLAAPQVGVLRRVVVVDCEDGDGLVELINPVLVAQDGSQDGAEGCLSVPNKTGMVLRPMDVTVRAQNRHGAFFEISGTDLKARTFCHEIDHLDGILFTELASRYLTEEEVAKLAEQENQKR